MEKQLVNLHGTLPATGQLTVWKVLAWSTMTEMEVKYILEGPKPLFNKDEEYCYTGEAKVEDNKQRKAVKHSG